MLQNLPSAVAVIGALRVKCYTKLHRPSQVRECLTLKAPIATKVVCEMFKKPLWQKVWTQRSSLFWVNAVCFYTLFVNPARQLFAADDFSRRHFQMHFLLGALWVKPVNCNKIFIFNNIFKKGVITLQLNIQQKWKKNIPPLPSLWVSFLFDLNGEISL